jgi:hypothetical protein
MNLELWVNLRQTRDTTCDRTRDMSPEIPERSFEDAIEFALLAYGPDARTFEHVIQEIVDSNFDLYKRIGVSAPASSGTAHRGSAP